MSDDNVSFGYSPLGDFTTSGYTIPKEINIIPVYKIKNGGDVYGVLSLNSNLCVKSLGMRFSRGKTIQSYIVDSLRYNSLGAINISEEYAKNNSFVAYSTSYDVYNGKTDINSQYQIIIFVEIEINEIEEMQTMIHQFKTNFKSKLAGVIDSESESIALFYMNCTEMYYLMRFTSGRFTDEAGIEYFIDIESDGFPARSFITELYEPDYSKGEIPITDKYDHRANTCPEIDFYTKIDQNLGVAFVAYSRSELPFMER